MTYILKRSGVFVAIALITLVFHMFGQPASRGDRGYYTAPNGMHAAATP